MLLAGASQLCVPQGTAPPWNVQAGSRCVGGASSTRLGILLSCGMSAAKESASANNNTLPLNVQKRERTWIEWASQPTAFRTAKNRISDRFWGETGQSCPTTTSRATRPSLFHTVDRLIFAIGKHWLPRQKIALRRPSGETIASVRTFVNIRIRAQPEPQPQ